MSYAEVKKINSDMAVPLNHWLWINDYKMYGQGSYVFLNKNIFNELMRSKVAVNDTAMRADVRNYLNETNELHSFFEMTIGFNSSGFENIRNIFDIADNPTVLGKMLHNKILFDDLITYPALRTAILASEEREKIYGLLNASTLYHEWQASVKSAVCGSSMWYDTPCYLESGFNLVSNQPSQLLKSGQTGFSYTKLDGTKIIISEPITHGLPTVAQGWSSVNQIVRSWETKHAFWHQGPDGGEETQHNAQAKYKPIL